jgi:hypothetical protein
VTKKEERNVWLGWKRNIEHISNRKSDIGINTLIISLGSFFDNRNDNWCWNRKVLWIEMFEIRMSETLFG